MKMLLKVSNRDYFRHSWGMFFYMFFCLSLPYILDSKDGDGTAELAIQLSLGFFLLMCVPAIILIIRYANVNNSLEITYRNERLELSQEGNRRTIELSEIDHIETKLPIPVYFNGFRFFATDSLFYTVIYLETEENFTVTTLLDNELLDTNAYLGDKFEIVRKLRPICWPPNHNLKFAVN